MKSWPGQMFRFECDTEKLFLNVKSSEQIWLLFLGAVNDSLLIAPFRIDRVLGQN